MEMPALPKGFTAAADKSGGEEARCGCRMDGGYDQYI